MSSIISGTKEQKLLEEIHIEEKKNLVVLNLFGVRERGPLSIEKNL